MREVLARGIKTSRSSPELCPICCLGARGQDDINNGVIQDDINNGVMWSHSRLPSAFGSPYWFRLEGERGLVPYLFPIGVGTMGQRRSRQRSPKEASDPGRHHPGTVGGIISEWRAALSRNGRQVPKNRAPDSAERTGAPHVARGAGGWSARHSCKS